MLYGIHWENKEEEEADDYHNVGDGDDKNHDDKNVDGDDNNDDDDYDDNEQDDNNDDSIDVDDAMFGTTAPKAPVHNRSEQTCNPFEQKELSSLLP